MNFIKNSLLFTFAVSAIYQAPALAQTNGTLLERPPQFVLISFDGSKSANFWQESFQLGDKTKSRFSYFISGVYFVPKAKKSMYRGPRHGTGQSDIGWGEDDPQAISNRTQYVWSGLSKGHDIGSHANGHFDGGRWNYSEWTNEFKYFHQFIEQVFSISPKVVAPFSSQWATTLKKNMVGFRAPLLAENDSTQRVLKDFGYTYNASGQTESKWPYQMKNGVWDMGLARVTLAGTKVRTVAMDYNMFYSQCKGKFSKTGSECQGMTDATAKRFEDQTYQSYMQTFVKNYNSNRAPFSVGHHFSLWNRGAYWKALQRFALAVCTQPDVKCITHKEMVAYMQDLIKQQGPGVIEKLNAGKFEKTISRPLAIRLADLAGNTNFLESLDDSPEVLISVDHANAHKSEDDVDMTGYRIAP